jgi:hypothetical protein
MKPHNGTRWRTWLALLLITLICTAVLQAWLVPENIVAWLQLLALCA